MGYVLTNMNYQIFSAAAETSVHGHRATVLDVAGCFAAVDGQAAAVDCQAAIVDGQAATVLIVVGHSAAFGIAEEKDGIVTHLPCMFFSLFYPISLFSF